MESTIVARKTYINLEERIEFLQETSIEISGWLYSSINMDNRQPPPIFAGGSCISDQGWFDR